MNKPILTVIAGCNGSGKSSFSSALTPLNTPSFDYDKEFLVVYNSQDDSELRELISHNKVKNLLQHNVDQAIENGTNFTYETNFNSTPLYWPEKFKKAGFELHLFFFCLNSIDEAKRRVQIRVENGGHFVPDNEIEKRYHLGFKHLNQHWTYFDQVFIFETSAYKQEPFLLISIVNGEVEVENDLPKYLDNLIPTITNK